MQPANAWAVSADMGHFISQGKNHDISGLPSLSLNGARTHPNILKEANYILPCIKLIAVQIQPLEVSNRDPKKLKLATTGIASTLQQETSRNHYKGCS